MLKWLLSLMLIAMPCHLLAQSTIIQRTIPKTEKKAEQKKKQGKRSDIMQQRRRQQQAEQRRREEQQAEQRRREEQQAEIAEKEQRRQEQAEQRRREEQQAENAEKERRRQEEAERQRIINNLVSNMVYVQGGTFTMGATPEQGRDADDDEKPTHEVTLSSYYIGKYEVTQREWQAVMGSNPSKFKGDNRPVEQVSWNDCQAFIRKLNQLTGRNFRLPTEAEWEYAARGGNRSKGYKYAGSNHIDNVAWYGDNSGDTTHDVGLKQPNELGLYDMSGSVWEWCSDWYGDYSSSAQTNPRGASSGSYRVFRGGSWSFSARFCRVSNRGHSSPDSRIIHLGLRLVL